MATLGDKCYVTTYLHFIFLLFIYLMYLLFIFGCIGSELQHVGSFVEARGLLSSCGTQASL